MNKRLTKREIIKRLKDIQNEAQMPPEAFLEMLNKRHEGESFKHERRDYCPLMLGWVLGGIEGILKEA